MSNPIKHQIHLKFKNRIEGQEERHLQEITNLKLSFSEELEGKPKFESNCYLLLVIHSRHIFTI